jgi:hypothetical protein
MILLANSFSAGGARDISQCSGEGGVTAQLAVENVAHNYLTALANLITRPQFRLTLNIQSGSALARRSALSRVLPLR